MILTAIIGVGYHHQKAVVEVMRDYNDVHSLSMIKGRWSMVEMTGQRDREVTQYLY